jgi:hypothetical protein
MRLFSKYLIIGIFCLLARIDLASAGSSGWSWGVGYHNPPNATIGLNFMHLWSNWAFELGVGYINSTESSSNNSSNDTSNSENKTVNLAVAGDMNLKYLFSSGTFRPYLQGGTYVGAAAAAGDQSGASASVGGGFAGAGFFIMGSSVDFYVSYITAGNGSFQFGFNF